MKKRKVDQDLLVFLTKTHSGMLNEDQGQHEDPEDVLDAVVLKHPLSRVSQCDCNGSVPEEILRHRI